MTVPALTDSRSGPYAANGSNRNWTYDFKVAEVGDVVLWVFDASGALTEVNSSLFTVSALDDNAGGTIVYPIAPTAALPTGNTVYVVRKTVLKQPSSFRNQGAFFPEMHDKALDRLVMMIQDYFLANFGARLLSGSGVPNNITLGDLGDFYIRTGVWTIYGPKTSGGWGSATSLVGPQGIQGIQGIQGPQGIQGIQGATGTGLQLKGVVALVANLPPTGNTAGDAYLVTNDGHVYIWNGSAWIDGGALQGPQGPQGPQGIQGVPGDPSTLLASANTWTNANTIERTTDADALILRNTDNTTNGRSAIRFQRGNASGVTALIDTLGDASNGVGSLRFGIQGVPVARVIHTASALHRWEFLRQAYFALQTLTDAATINWDCNTQQCAQVTLGGNRTMGAPTNPVAGSVYNLLVRQDGTGGRTLSFANAAFQFPGGTEPVVASGANDKTLLSFFYDGANFLGLSALDFS